MNILSETEKALLRATLNHSNFFLHGSGNEQLRVLVDKINNAKSIIVCEKLPNDGDAILSRIGRDLRVRSMQVYRRGNEIPFSL